DGDHWQSLRLNMPVVSIHDLAIEQDDLVAATYGRSFWILDDVTPLRQISTGMAAGAAHLFAPRTAIRVRRDENQDTPLPPEVPAGKNPRSEERRVGKQEKCGRWRDHDRSTVT